MPTTDPRARQLAETVHGLAREKATTLPAWPDLSLSEREKVTAEARLWLRGAVDAGLVPAAVSSPPATDRATVLAWAADFAEEVAEKLRAHHEFERSNGALDVMTELRRMADEAQPVSATCPHCKRWYVTSEPGAHEASCPRKPAAEAQPEPETRPCPDREPLIGVQCSKPDGHEGPHSDRPGRIWYPVPDDEDAEPDTGDDHSCAESGCSGEPTAAGVRQPDTETPCERCGHAEQAHNISGCTLCHGGWRADHRFMSVDHPPADPWSVEYHRLGAARLNPALCTCGLGPDAIVHNEPPHPFNGRPKPGMPPVYGICTNCHHHETAACHVAVSGRPAADDSGEETP